MQAIPIFTQQTNRPNFSSRMLKVLVISSDYPSPEYIYGDVFVHTRLKEYRRHFNVVVAGFNANLAADRVFVNEGIPVTISKDVRIFEDFVRTQQPDVIVVHFVQFQFLDFLESLAKPLIIFAHGYDTTSWKRRLMNYDTLGSVRYLLPYIRSNRKQLHALRQFIIRAASRQDIHFVYVSEWLKQAATEDLGVTISHSHVIPNGINTTLFNPPPRTAEHRKKILLLRSFKAINYGNDMAMEVILLLSKKDFFHELEFSIYGEGYLFNSLTSRVKHLPNVTINNFFVENAHIPEIHAGYGIFLCPSRLDSQGVSMCEAMSSGLVPVTTPIGGIPEFVTHEVSGFLEKSPVQMAARIEYLYKNPDVFLEMSQASRAAIEAKCPVEETTQREVELILSVLTKSTIEHIG